MKKLLIVAALATLGFTACSSDHESYLDGGTPRSIAIDPTLLQMGASTRATDVDFEAGDAIGLDITMAGDQSLYKQNERLVFNGTNFVSEGELLWYEDIGLKSNLVAYYPYNAVQPQEFTVKQDQATGKNYTLSDLMLASKNEVQPTLEATHMVFRHALTKLVVNLNNVSGGKIVSVAFKGAVPTATLDLKQGTVAVKSEVAPQDVVAKPIVEGKQYAAIIVPQTVQLQLAVTLNVNGGEKVLTQTYKTLDLLNGQYSVAVDVKPEKIEMSVSGEIEDWTDNGSLEGEGDAGGEGSEVPFEEFEDHFVYDGVTYPIKKFDDGNVWMTTNLRYLPKGLTPSADPAEDAHVWYTYKSDGTTCTADTTPEALEKFGYLYDAEAVWGQPITPENSASFEGKQGICPKGWHIPTQMEFVGLVGKTNKTADGVDLTNEQAPYWDKDYDGGRITRLNEVGWNVSRAGTRFCGGVTATGMYQKVCDAQTKELNLTFFMSSTLYKNLYKSSDPQVLNNIQYFGLMTTFTSAYPEGKLSVAYNAFKSGVAVRCVKDK